MCNIMDAVSRADYYCTKLRLSGS